MNASVTESETLECKWGKHRWGKQNWNVWSVRKKETRYTEDISHIVDANSEDFQEKCSNSSTRCHIEIHTVLTYYFILILVMSTLSTNTLLFSFHTIVEYKNVREGSSSSLSVG